MHPAGTGRSNRTGGWQWPRCFAQAKPMWSHPETISFLAMPGGASNSIATPTKNTRRRSRSRRMIRRSCPAWPRTASKTVAWTMRRPRRDAPFSFSPSDPEINLLLSEILVAQGRYDEAEPHLKVSLGVQKGEVARVHALLGKVYARSARPRQAMAELKQALSGDADGSAHYQLGRLYQEMGDNKDAALMFAQCKILVAKRDARDKTLTQ